MRLYRAEIVLIIFTDYPIIHHTCTQIAPWQLPYYSCMSKVSCIVKYTCTYTTQTKLLNLRLNLVVETFLHVISTLINIQYMY